MPKHLKDQAEVRDSARWVFDIIHRSDDNFRLEGMPGFYILYDFQSVSGTREDAQKIRQMPMPPHVTTPTKSPLR